MSEIVFFGGELLGPLLETSLIGGLTASALVYEHYRTSNDEQNLNPLLSYVPPETTPRFIVPALIFFINELILVSGYTVFSLFKYDSGVSVTIYLSSFIFIIGIIFLIWDTPKAFQYMNHSRLQPTKSEINPPNEEMNDIQEDRKDND